MPSFQCKRDLIHGQTSALPMMPKVLSTRKKTLLANLQIESTAVTFTEVHIHLI